jgi:hypothetical protein
LLSVQRITPDDGQRNCPKHVEFHFQNKFEKLVRLVGYYKENRNANVKSSPPPTPKKRKLKMEYRGDGNQNQVSESPGESKQEATSDDIAHVSILLTPNMETPDVTFVSAPWENLVVNLTHTRT